MAKEGRDIARSCSILVKTKSHHTTISVGILKESRPFYAENSHHPKERHTAWQYRLALRAKGTIINIQRRLFNEYETISLFIYRQVLM